MKLYINFYDNDDVAEIEINDADYEAIKNADDEGRPDYEKGADNIRNAIKAMGFENPCEAYTTYELADRCFDPILGL